MLLGINLRGKVSPPVTIILAFKANKLLKCCISYSIPNTFGKTVYYKIHIQ